MLEKKEKEKRLWRALVPGREVSYKHPRSSRRKHQFDPCHFRCLCLLGSLVFLVATADFQGVVCEWCLLPGFGHDDGYSFAKYSQI